MGKRPKVNIDTKAQAAAQQAQVSAIQAQTKAVEDQAAAANKAAEAKRVIDENMATDLTNQDKGTVVAGGSADAVESVVVNATPKKRRSTGSLSSQLGVNL